MLGLRCSIYKNAEFGDFDCSNRGISSRCKKVTLVGPEVAGVFKPDPDAPAVEFVVRDIMGQEYLTAYPAGYKESGKLYMFGGCFIYSSDSRFKDLATYPIPLHDRIE